MKANKKKAAHKNNDLILENMHNMIRVGHDLEWAMISLMEGVM